MKTIVLVLLALIVASLGSGLFYLSRKNEDPTKILNALKIRITLSVVLVLFLVLSFVFGWIQPPR